MLLRVAAALLLPGPSLRCSSTTNTYAPTMNTDAAPSLVVHKGKDFLVVNKPPGMIVHDGEGSLIAALDALGHSNYDPCHRLDAETSGVLICAKKGSTGRIQKCLTAAETIKQYRGIVRGSMKGRGTWTQSLSPKAEGRKNPRGVAATRVAAVTEYTVLEETAYLTAADFVLRSGRTHQIRKHAACNKHQIIGDVRYGDPRHASDTEKRYGFSGLALHSA
eukprot:6886274-Prymnesium_polylepis.1